MEKVEIQEFIIEEKNCQDYDAIGFDADNCLIRYNIPILSKLLYEAYVNTLLQYRDIKMLQQKNKSIEFKEYFMKDFEELIGLGLNYTVIDIKNAIILKFDSNKKIQKAFQGTKQLNTEQIQKIYGKYMVFDSGYEIQNARINKKYQLISGFYESQIYLLFAKLYELLKELNCFTYSNEQIFEQFVQKSQHDNIKNYDENQVFDIQNFGNFYPKYIENIESCVIQQTNFKQILSDFKKNNPEVILFIVSNSRYEYLNISMTQAYGKDWLDLFDVVVVHGQKPGFFINSQRVMYNYDQDSKLRISENPLENIQDQEGIKKVYVQGNYKFVEDYIKMKSMVEYPTIAYMGDNYFSDCFYSQNLYNWDAFFICEEIIEEQQIIKNPKIQKYNIYEYQSKWESYFYQTEIQNDKSEIQVESFWYLHIKNNIEGGIFGQIDSEFALKNFWLQTII